MNKVVFITVDENMIGKPKKQNNFGAIRFIIAILDFFLIATLKVML